MAVACVAKAPLLGLLLLLSCPLSRTLPIAAVPAGALAGNLTVSGGRPVSVVPFAWKTCGDPSDPMQISEMSLEPAPVTFSKTEERQVIVSLTAALSANIVQGSAVKLLVKKRVPYTSVYEKIPCIDHMGSCEWTDACGQLEVLMPTCNDWFDQHKISCHCPIVAQSFSAPTSTFVIPPVGEYFPSWLADGDFQLEVSATDSAGASLGCVFMQVSVHLDP